MAVLGCRSLVLAINNNYNNYNDYCSLYNISCYLGQLILKIVTPYTLTDLQPSLRCRSLMRQCCCIAIYMMVIPSHYNIIFYNVVSQLADNQNVATVYNHMNYLAITIKLLPTHALDCFPAQQLARYSYIDKEQPEQREQLHKEGTSVNHHVAS